MSLSDVNCYMPANGETVTLLTHPNIPVGISLGLLKREMALGTVLSGWGRVRQGQGPTGQRRKSGQGGGSGR